MSENNRRLAETLWRIYRRPARPTPWAGPSAGSSARGGNLPWNEPAFSERMLREHLDESHGAASRVTAERERQINWLWPRLNLGPGARVLDVTCGPGLYALELARRGCQVTGVDFSPAAVAYARAAAERQGLAERCTIVEQDVRKMAFGKASFDAALFIYGQLAVFTKAEAQAILAHIAGALRPGGRLVVELLDQDRVDKKRSTWWFTDERALWGESPFLHLGERFWLAEEKMSAERFYTIHLDDGRLSEVLLCDQTYSVEEMVQMMTVAGFAAVQVYRAWGGLDLYDAREWVAYVAEREVGEAGATG